MYKIDELWFRINRRLTKALSPPIIQPLTKPAWKYTSPDSLAERHLFIKRSRLALCFLSNDLPRWIPLQGVQWDTIPTGSISLSNLLNEESLDRIAKSQKLWHRFITFGSASAGVLVIFMIFRFMKLIIDTLIHGYALHSIYGWSVHLLGAIWSFVTNLLLHMGRPITREPTQRAKDYVIISTITSDPSRMCKTTPWKPLHRHQDIR